MLPVLLVAALLSPQETSEDTSANTLVWYDFEDDDLESGPTTFMVFEGAQGSVNLSSAYRYSGYRSVEIRDVANDGKFAELQGFFNSKWRGYLYIHFAMLIAQPDDVMNIAFAGKSHFSMREHGIGIWLKLHRGTLYQVNAGEDSALLEVDSFVWYVVDIAYDVDRGTYDLVIHAEGQDDPVVAVSDQTNAVGIPGSQLWKYSFIGDVPGTDHSDSWFYIDDILLTNDLPVSETPFVAPGRRMLFVDMYDKYQARLYEKPGCVPILGYEDFGLAAPDLSELAAAGGLDLLSSILKGEDVALPRRLTPFLRRRLSAVRDYTSGCRNPAEALTLFRRAAEKVPGAKIYPMSEVLALARLQKWPESDALLLDIYTLWQDDPRFPAISASLGLARGDLDYAEQWLQAASDGMSNAMVHPLVRRLWSGDIGPGLADELKQEFPSEWPSLVQAALTADLRFYVLLWQRRYDDARYYAERMTTLFDKMRLPSGRWLERRGDAAFYAGDYVEAQSGYEASLAKRDDPSSVLLKLSDVHFKLGNLELERHYREKIYGSLRPQ